MGGSLKIEASCLDSLPDTGSIGQFAQALGVSFQTVRMWIIMEGAPAQRVEDKMRWILEKESFSYWLKMRGKVSDP